MERHLARCPACHAFADELARVTETLREAVLAEPSVRFELPRRASRFGVTRVGTAAAAAILVVVALGAALGPGASSPDSYLANALYDQDSRAMNEHLSLVQGGTKAIPRGVAAAERTTLGARAGRTPEVSEGAPAEGW